MGRAEIRQLAGCRSPANQRRWLAGREWPAKR
ncbi:MAG: DUF4224 domain-containing protein [Proteobacteria bacterium]|nr:DUF4224 domain-containing protein [Pseudomonadota bacterium]